LPSFKFVVQHTNQSRSVVENLLAITTNFTFSILTNFTSYKKVDHFPIITIDKTFGPFIEEMWLCTFCVVLRISQFCYLLLLYDYCLLSTGLCVKGQSGPTWQLKPKSVPEKDLELWMIQSLRVIENDWDGWDFWESWKWFVLNVYEYWLSGYCILWTVILVYW